MYKLPIIDTKAVEELNIDEIALIVDKQPRLQEFVRCLYTGEKYRVSDLKSLDDRNFIIAQRIIKNIYPECRGVFSKHF